MERLALISKALGPKSLSLMVDHLDQLLNVTTLRELSGNAPSVFLKIEYAFIFRNLLKFMISTLFRT